MWRRRMGSGMSLGELGEAYRGGKERKPRGPREKHSDGETSSRCAVSGMGVTDKVDLGVWVAARVVHGGREVIHKECAPVCGRGAVAFARCRWARPYDHIGAWKCLEERGNEMDVRSKNEDCFCLVEGRFDDWMDELHVKLQHGCQTMMQTGGFEFMDEEGVQGQRREEAWRMFVQVTTMMMGITAVWDEEWRQCFAMLVRFAMLGGSVDSGTDAKNRADHR